MNMRGDPPTQAVIFAGGRGTRLEPFTSHLPKPLITTAGRPFIDYLIELLRDQGFDRIVMLLGYRADDLENYLGDGAGHGVHVTHVRTPPEIQTVSRLRAALPLLDEKILIAYCDNYVPLDFPAMWRQFAGADAALQVTTYANADGYTRSNMRVDDSGLVHEYDASRASPGLNQADLGFAIADLPRILPLPDEDLPFEHSLYPRLARAGQLRAAVTRHRYYGVGSLQRLADAEEFFRRRPTVIMDLDWAADGDRAAGRGTSAPVGLALLGEMLEARRLFAASGFRVLIMTGQAEAPRGAVPGGTPPADQRRQFLDALMPAAEAGAVYRYRHDPAAPRDSLESVTEALYQAQRDFLLDLSRTAFLGSSCVHELAARAAGCRYLHAASGGDLGAAARELTETTHAGETL